LNIIKLSSLSTPHLNNEFRFPKKSSLNFIRQSNTR
jgi:hypothetical protein